MSDIKFRGRRKDNNEWVYGSYIYLLHDNNRESHFIQQADAKWYSKPEYNRGWFHVKYEVIPETVGQFTGLCDRNGKEIYFDSDIVEYTFDTGSGRYPEDKETVIGVVVLDLRAMLSLCVKTKGGALYHFTASELRNVVFIGDIHSNPELLEKAL